MNDMLIVYIFIFIYPYLFVPSIDVFFLDAPNITNIPKVLNPMCWDKSLNHGKFKSPMGWKSRNLTENLWSILFYKVKHVVMFFCSTSPSFFHLLQSSSWWLNQPFLALCLCQSRRLHAMTRKNRYGARSTCTSGILPTRKNKRIQVKTSVESKKSLHIVMASLP